MTSRSAAAILGLLAGIAIFFTLSLNWGAAIQFLRAETPAAYIQTPVARLAWTICGAGSGFAILALLVAWLGGAAEISRARREIDRLRLDPDIAARWNAADWRAAFANTAIADQAEAMIALLPVENGETRRVIVDTTLLLGLNRIWLDRLTLHWTITPMPAILVAFAATLAMFTHEAGGRWAVVLAAGAASWFVIRLFQFIVRSGLAPVVDSAVSAATAAVRPLSAAHAFDPRPQTKPVIASETPKRIEQEEAEIIAAALSNAIWEPLGRLADAAQKLSAPSSRDQSIESTLAEVRAGIEKLLAGVKLD